MSRWRLIFLSLCTLWGILTAIPSLMPTSAMGFWPSWFPQKAVTLGLDLQGGVHLLLEVETGNLVKEKYANWARLIRNSLRKEKIFFSNLIYNNNGLTFNLINASQKDQVQKILKELNFEQSSLSIKDNQISFVLDPAAKSMIAKQAVNRSIEVIRRRIDKTGAMEPLIQAQGDNRIILQIPGFEDPARVHDLLGKTAKLEFHWVVDQNHPSEKNHLLAFDRNDGEESTTAQLPIDSEILMSGEDIVQAKGLFHSTDMGGSEAVVQLSMTGQGTRIFSDLTQQANHGRRLAIILDNKILSAPSISTQIPDGNGIITGMKDIESAQNLAILINSGSLPAPLKTLEEKVVGPQLGKDSITQGTKGVVMAIGAVILWMLAIYSGFGVFAVVGILCNVCLLFSALVLLGATLTLPGLAGIALTVGMSVDANVLINERIKEELRTGKTLINAIQEGYAKAKKSIIDSNFTTLAGSIVLCFTGSGPVKGFAVTMALGILISLFTAIGLTSLLVQLWLKRNPKKIWL